MISSISMVLLMFVCHVGVLNTKVEASHWYNITNEEDMELEKQIKILNKSSVKTIQSEYGDLYDCVDFYKQPAFDHPLLKDYKFDYKMKPTLSPRSRNDQASDEKRKPANFKLKGGGCPVGTVPIRRITKEDLIRERYISTIRPLIGDYTTGAHYAVLQTRPSGNKYNGAGGMITLHNPQCTNEQYSAARVKVQNGPDSIEAGWRVDPALYGDQRTRLYVRFDAGEAYCFNTRCPGFVIVNTDIPLDHAYDQVSQPGGQFYYQQLFLNRDLINGNWWLELGEDHAQIGFWPARIFTGLSDWATLAEWGGEVFSPPGTIKPPMGAGESILRNSSVDAYIFQCSLFDGKSTLDLYNTKNFADTRNYRVEDLGFLGKWHRRLVVYGGPSGY